MIKKIFLFSLYFIQLVNLHAMDGSENNSPHPVRKLHRRDSSEMLREIRNAINKGDLDSVVGVVEQDADPRWQVTAVGEAISLRHYDLTEQLLQKGYPAFFPNDKKFVQPLRAAVNARDPKMVSLVLGYDSNIDFADDQGNTYLHVLVQQGDQPETHEMIRLFMSKNADITKKNSEDMTPFEIIQEDQTPGLYSIFCQFHPELNEHARREQSPRNAKKRSRSTSPNKKNEPSLQLEEEQSIGIASTLGYFGLGALGAMAILALYDLATKKASPDNKASQPN
jgi:ankyrin repeat protein